MHVRQDSVTTIAPNEGGDGCCNNAGCCYGCCGVYTTIVVCIWAFYMIPQIWWWAECKDHRTFNTSFSCGSVGSYFCFGVFPSCLLFCIGIYIACRWYNTRQTIFKPISSKRGICIGWTIGMLIPILLAPNVYWWADIHQDLDKCRAGAVGKSENWCDTLKTLDSLLIAAACVEIPWGVILICLTYGIVSHKIQNPLVKVHKLTSWKKGDRVRLDENGHPTVLATVQFEGLVDNGWRIGLELDSPRDYSKNNDCTEYFRHEKDHGYLLSFKDAEVKLNPIDDIDEPDHLEGVPPHGKSPYLPVGDSDENYSGPDMDPYESRPKTLPRRELYQNVLIQDNTGILHHSDEEDSQGWYVEILGWERERSMNWAQLLQQDYAREQWAREAYERALRWHENYGDPSEEVIIDWIVDEAEPPYAWLGHPKAGINRLKLQEGLQMSVTVTAIKRDPAPSDVPGEDIGDMDDNNADLRWYAVESVLMVVSFDTAFHPSGTIPFTEEKPVVYAGHYAVVLSAKRVEEVQGGVNKDHLGDMWDHPNNISDDDDEDDDMHNRELVAGYGGYGGSHGTRDV